jgi:hypothetical protein
VRFLVERMTDISGKELAAGEAGFDSLDLIELAKRLTVSGLSPAHSTPGADRRMSAR